MQHHTTLGKWLKNPTCHLPGMSGLRSLNPKGDSDISNLGSGNQKHLCTANGESSDQGSPTHLPSLHAIVNSKHPSLAGRNAVLPGEPVQGVTPPPWEQVWSTAYLLSGRSVRLSLCFSHSLYSNTHYSSHFHSLDSSTFSILAPPLCPSLLL